MMEINVTYTPGPLPFGLREGGMRKRRGEAPSLNSLPLSLKGEGD
jgi:hypothetical protein